MNSNKSHLAHERRRPGGVTKTILSAVAVSAILNAAPAMAQTPAPPQHAAPAMQDVATPVQPLSVLPATGLGPCHRRAGNGGGETCASNK